MYKHRVTLKDGTVHYSFSYDDPTTGKRVKLKKSEHPHITTAAEADEWIASQDAQRKARLDRLARKEAFKNKFYDFTQLVERYRTYIKKKQRRSHETHFVPFEHYVLPFFLEKKQASNVNNWHLFYAEFRDWLEGEALTRKAQKLSYSYMNHAILSLNNFITFLTEYNLIDSDCAKKMSQFGEEYIGKKSFENVIEQTEYDQIYLRLKHHDEDSADLFQLLYATGMRINEAISLPLSCLYTGNISGILHAELEEKKLTYIGYIVLESQAEDRHERRDEDGKVPRVPLKGRKSIDSKNSRIIPIFDKEVWNMLVKRYLLQQTEYNRTPKPYGTDKNNYLLFDGLATSTFAKNMSKAYEGTGYTPKTPHDCRHSFCTLFVGKTRSMVMARTILGHKSSSFERYLHIYEQMTRTAKQGSQTIDFVK